MGRSIETKVTYKVRGMHCPACEALVHEAASEAEVFKNIRVSLSARRLSAVLVANLDEEAAKAKLEEKFKPLGYSLYKNTRTETLKEYIIGGLGALVFIGLYLLINMLGLNPHPLEFTPGSAFIIGLVASVSTCFALVGGVMISYFGSVSADNPKLTLAAQIGFHAGRIASFLTAGAILGLVSDKIDLNTMIGSPVLLVAGLVMLFFSLQLLGIIPPIHFGRSTTKPRIQKGSHAIMSLLVGALTIFLPCSFTLLTMIEALSSGSALQGFLIMGGFVLGTLPVLVLSGIFLGRGLQGKFAVYLRRGSGFLVLGFGIFQIIQWAMLALKTGPQA